MRIAIGRDLNAAPPEIPGAKIATEADARRIALDAYARKANRANVLSATDIVRKIDVIVFGFDLPGFAKQGDKVWEVRFTGLEKELRAILWVHANSGDLHFLCGPWQSDGSQISSDEASSPP